MGTAQGESGGITHELHDGDGALDRHSAGRKSDEFPYELTCAEGGMPQWAQAIGEVFPLTHFLRIVRGILLKGNGIEDVALQLWQIVLFAVVALTIGVKPYHKTLD